MTVVDELAQDIWSSGEFRADLFRLESANLMSELRQSHVTEVAEALDPEFMTRLLQSAMIFSSIDDDQLNEVAQKISTAAFRLSDQTDEAMRDIFSLIQARLRNFPALTVGQTKPLAPRQAPLTLQYEFTTARNGQTVTLTDDSEHLLTPFQLEGWRLLAGRKSTTLTGPTSAGKSYILMMYLIDQFRKPHSSTIVYIVPTRALINQVGDDAQQALTRANLKDVSVTTIPVDLRVDGVPGKALYVLTQERLEALLITVPNFHVDIIVVDEAQILSESSRGVLLESVIDRVMLRSPHAQFVFSGPMIDNPTYFGEVFGFNDFKPCSTRRSPVTQNLIYLDYHPKPQNEVVVRLGDQGESHVVTKIPLETQLRTDSDRLSYLSCMFGRGGSSIVYVNGKAEAETTSIKIANEFGPDAGRAADLAELIKFVKTHIHKDYALVGTLAKGIGFHYGHMPSLLRKTLEDYFKARRLSFLVCTSTLLYGLNLPAKNIFMLKPTTGRGSAIAGSDFWNLAGRAGRLGKELEGNVYLINYADWKTEPVREKRDVSVTSALKTTIVDHATQLSEFLGAETVASEVNPEFEITLGKLVLDHRLGHLNRTIGRYRTVGNADALTRIAERIQIISDDIDLPSEVLNRSISVSVFRQKSLYDYMVKRLRQIPPEELIPAHPLVDFDQALLNYRRAFKRIHTYLLRYPGGDKRNYFFAPLALRWMRGDPLPVLIDTAIRYNKSNKTGRSTATIIRETMENVEEHLRFRYVKFFTCYNSISEFALKNVGLDQYVTTIPNVSLFLEMGGSSGAMINLMALGLSRTSAEALAEYITNKDMTLDQVRTWIRGRDFTQLDISPICIREAEQLAQNLASQTGG